MCAKLELRVPGLNRYNLTPDGFQHDLRQVQMAFSAKHRLQREMIRPTSIASDSPSSPEPVRSPETETKVKPTQPVM